MGNVAEPFVEPTYLNPPRFWWTKRIPIIAIATLACLALAWWRWDRAAQARVDAAVAAMRARGEPIWAEDFSVPAIADESNAAITINAAVAALPGGEIPFVATASVQVQSNAPLDAATLAGLHRVAKASTASRSLIRLARFQPAAVWTTNPFLSPPTFSNTTQLPRFLSLVALSEHLDGNDAEAIEIMRDMLRHSDGLQQRNQTLIMALVSMVLGQITNDTMARLAGDLEILPDATATTQPTGPASREQVRALIAALLDDDGLQRGLSRGYYTERAMRFTIIKKYAGQRIVPALPFPQQLLWPWAKFEVLRGVERLGDMAEVAEQPDFQAAQALATKFDKAVPKQSSLTNLVHQWILPQGMFSSRTDPLFKVIAYRRAMAVELAIRLYRMDHSGRSPAQLDDLVPQYMSRVPLDPYATGGKPLSYRTTPSPLVYSVGPDGVDNGGSALDAIFPIKSSKPAPATTKP